MELATTTATAAPPVARERPPRSEPRSEARSVAAGEACELPALTPPDPWTEALAQLAFTAGRARQLVLAADADGWPAAAAAHAVYLARRRVRALEQELAEPDAAQGRVVCWSA